MLRRIIILVLISGLSLWAESGKWFMAFWNVENLFDTVDDPRTNDDEFTPTGKSEWTQARLETKYQHLAQVINSMNAGKGPDVLGLAEVENRAVITALVKGHLKRKYKIIQQDSPDERGIDCVLLYDPAVITLKRDRFIPVQLPDNDKTRDIVEGQFVVAGKSFYVFINHWPSRWGGTEATDPLRRIAAATLRSQIDILQKADPAVDILIMGDLNDHPGDPSVLQVLAAKPNPDKLLYGELLNTIWPLNQDPRAGTYMYRGQWSVIDQVIVSRGLLDNRNFTWVKGSTGRFLKSYMLQQSGKYAGYPNRTYAGGNYLGGYSDHLPVYCEISFNQ